MMVEVSVSSPPTPPKKAPLTSGAGTFAPGPGRIAAWLAKMVEVALAPVDLTMPQYRVLSILADGSEAASGLANRLAVRPPSVTAIVDGLVARGFVDRRQEDSDRRRVALRITDEGARVVAQADRAVNDQLTGIAGHLSNTDRALALKSLELWGQALAASREARKAAEAKAAEAKAAEAKQITSPAQATSPAQVPSPAATGGRPA
jgi:long-chain acyl-CoA synthetase